MLIIILVRNILHSSLSFDPLFILCGETSYKIHYVEMTTLNDILFEGMRIRTTMLPFQRQVDINGLNLRHCYDLKWMFCRSTLNVIKQWSPATKMFLKKKVTKPSKQQTAIWCSRFKNALFFLNYTYIYERPNIKLKKNTLKFLQLATFPTTISNRRGFITKSSSWNRYINFI